MSYAQAAGTRGKSYGAHYNEKVLICHAGQNSNDQVADALYNNGYWDHVKVFLKSRSLPDLFKTKVDLLRSSS